MYLDYTSYAELHEFSTDIVVVGTGAGGAVAGTELAEAGHSVLFVEEGGHHPTTSFNPYATESLPRLYRDGGATVILGDPPIPYAEGRCVGGSTVVNGGMTYRAPDKVLEGWAKSSGESELGSAGMERLYQRVESRINATPQDELSIGNDSRLMTEGAKRLGWRYSVNRRNQVSCVGSNNCVFGCPTGAKQSTLVSYLPRAIANGAHCLTELRIEKLLIEGGRCVGVQGRAINPRSGQPDRSVTIRAQAVVIACGAVQTPLLLQKHRAIQSRQLGKNLLCHPNAKLVAIYPFDVEGWRGVSQNTQIREFRDEGLLFGENFIPPAVLAAHMPFQAEEAWEYMQRYNQMVICGVLVEDSTTGSVGRFLGAPYARYQITKRDHARFLRGVKLLATLHFEMGAEFVQLPFANFPIARSVDDLSSIESTQHHMSTLELFTVHIMGTARMGSDPKTSVVDPSGQLWDLPGCYVADASIFPTAIGVNPQLTIMALATRIAHRISETRLAA